MEGYYIGRIKEHGRLTYARRMVLKTLLDVDRHVSVDFLHMTLPDMGIATIYRVLVLFETLDLIESVKSGRTNYYKMKVPQKNMHLHFVCETCHRIIEHEHELIQKWIKSLDVSFSVQYILVKGWCDHCMN